MRVGTYAIRSASRAADDFLMQVGDTVYVGRGTYTEDLTFNTANLTFRSVEGPALTTLVGVDGVHIDAQAGADGLTIGGSVAGAFTINSGAATTFLVQLANAPSDVTISHNDFDLTGNASMGVSVGAAGATGLDISTNTFTTADGGDGAIWAPSVVDLTIDGNDFDGPGKDAAGGGYAIQTAGATGTSVINNNTVDDWNLGIVVLSGNGGTDGLAITNNTMTACNNGIYFYDNGAGTVQNVTVTGNTVTHASAAAGEGTYGLRIAPGANLTPTTWTITGNTFNFSQMQVFDGTGTLDLDAIYGDNGDTTGNTFNQAAWADSGQTIWYDIQDAIDDATDPDTVNVGEATYVEDLVINTPNITLKSFLLPADTILQGVNGVHIDVQAGGDGWGGADPDQSPWGGGLLQAQGSRGRGGSGEGHPHPRGRLQVLRRRRAQRGDASRGSRLRAP